MLADILRQVSGEVPEDACVELDTLVKGLPDKSLVLDLLPGHGRSSVVLASAMRRYGKDAHILAIDTHIRNPRSNRAFEEGTFSVFQASKRTFTCAEYIIPVLSPLNVVESFLTKRSANLVVVQVPRGDSDPIGTLGIALKLAAYTIRSGGFIAICPGTPDIILPQEFDRVDKYTALAVFKATKGDKS